MENEDRILTGKDLNLAKERVKDEEVEKLLKAAQKQLEHQPEKKAAKEAKARRKELEAEEAAKAEAEAKKRKAEMEKAAKEVEEKRKKVEAEEAAREEERRKKTGADKKQTDAVKTAREAQEKRKEEAAAALQMEMAKGVVPFNPEEDVFVDKSLRPVEYQKEKVTIGQIIGTILEVIWTCFKWTVIIGIVTVIAGFLLSRELMIRGRNGDRESVSGMKVSTEVLENKASEDEKVERWLRSVNREKRTLEADDSNILVARQIVINENSDKWAVVLHGYNGSMEDVYDIAMRYANEGYNILTPDLRASGESEGAFLGMGWLERLDIINWIDLILEDNPSAEIVIHGIDIGADTALMLSGEPLKSSVKAIIAEGAYNNAWEVVKKEYELRHEKLPVFPFMYMMSPVMKVWAGYTLKEADAVKQVKNTTVPILLIHGKGDTYATEEMTGELDRAIASPHKVLNIEKGTHEDCRYAEPDTYYDSIFDFLKDYVD